MKRLLAILSLGLLPFGAFAAGGPAVELESANIDLSNEASIQRGAKMFVNYCMGCHSAEYVRYKQFTKVGLTEDQIKDNLIFDDSKMKKGKALFCFLMNPPVPFFIGFKGIHL